MIVTIQFTIFSSADENEQNSSRLECGMAHHAPKDIDVSVIGIIGMSSSAQWTGTK